MIPMDTSFMTDACDITLTPHISTRGLEEGDIKVVHTGCILAVHSYGIIVLGGGGGGGGGEEVQEAGLN